MQFDHIDESILSILTNDGRTTNKEIARSLKVSEGTVRNRINRMIETGSFQIKGLIDAESRKEKQLVYVMIKLSGNRNSIEVARMVAALEPIRSVSIIAGRFDLLAEIYIEPHSLIEFLNTDLSRIESVLTVESLITLKNFNKWI
ncbi:MAG: Lrp/AsnC family transcriptional regulator [Spirochaetia bacterium]